jgi:hypothetical protein
MRYYISKTVTMYPSLITHYLKLFLASLSLHPNGDIPVPIILPEVCASECVVLNQPVGLLTVLFKHKIFNMDIRNVQMCLTYVLYVHIDRHRHVRIVHLLMCPYVAFLSVCVNPLPSGSVNV